MLELRTIPIRQSLNRSTLILGAERELVLMTGLITFTLIFISMSPIIILLGISFWMVLIAILRMMAKNDPLMSKVYLKHIKYKNYYPPKSTPFRNG